MLALSFRITTILSTALVSGAAIAADAPDEWPHSRRGPYVVERLAPPPSAAFAEGEACRVIVKRRVDEFGERVVRRVRICEVDDISSPRRRWSPHPVPPRDLGAPSRPPFDVDDNQEEEDAG